MSNQLEWLHRIAINSLDESLDDIDSIQFELDEDAFKEMDDDGSSEEEVTLDVTEGGPCDVKNFHEIYQIDIDNDDNQESVIDKQSKIKMERPKSAKTRIRNVKPSLEIKDDIDNYIDANVDEDDDFSLNSIENDPFASEGASMFKVSRQDFITVPSFPLNQLETLKEEPDEDIKKDDDEEEEEDGDEAETDEFEEDDLSNDDKQEDEDLPEFKQKHQLTDLIGQQANFRKMSDQLKREISKLKNELFTVITQKSDEIAKQATERLDQVEKRLSENEKNAHSALLDRNRKQIDVNNGPDSASKVDAIKLEVNSLKANVDKIMDSNKERNDKENDISKNLADIHDEFKITMDQFRDFKKDNDLAIKALRKQLTEVSQSQDNLESLTSKIQGDVHRLSRDVSNNRRDDDDEQDNLRIEVKQMIMKERIEHDKLAQSIEDIKQMLKSEITSVNQSLERRKQETELSQAAINDEMSQTKSVLHYLTKELDTIKQSIEEKKNESKESETTTINAALEERFNQIESNLTVMHGQLEAFKISKERDRKMRSKFDNFNSKRSKKLVSSCSSYEDTLSSSSEEVKSRTKQRSRTRKEHDIGTSNQNRSKVNFDHGMNRRRDYIKYSPLHFSPILITSQPMERSHNVKNSSSSLLAMIRRTSRLLQDEASDLDGLGNYRFVSDISNGLLNRNDLDADESAIRKLKQIRCDIDEKLKRLNTMVNSNSNGNNSSTTKQ
ncbi:probable serine/threonine-protein kinase kinX isoform X2 [Tetranychus urticae]|uniref:Uncharacterized protein n=1 Tax=Tetranychus urticae TaxID=32264 RepID=T1KT66_TETUR|nr:probable serine/threonine-protein kinase kinX isoform X2 [Tetranychus urticae]